MEVEWQEIRVGDLVNLGALAISDGYRVRNEELGPEGIPFVRGGDIGDGWIKTDTDDHIRPELADRVRAKLAQPGDAAFITKGTVGRSGRLRAGQPNVVFAPQVAYWRVIDPTVLDAGYLFYLMRSYEFRSALDAVKTHGSMVADYVSISQQYDFRFRFPRVETQRAIAHILGTLDDKIELNRRMNGTLEALARALFKSWFVDFDPVRARAEGRDPGVPKHISDLLPDSFEDSELGEIPTGWEVKRFGDAVEQLREQENPISFPDTLFHHFSIPAFDDGQSPKIEHGERIKSLKWRVPAGVVLLSKLNPEIDRVWLVDVGPDVRSVCSTEFLVLRARSPFTCSFIYCVARSPVFRQQIESLVTGTSKSHQRAQVDAILNLRIVAPPSPVVAAFDRSAERLLTRTFVCRREASSLASVRDALLSTLISGELRITGAERFTGSAGA